MKLNSLKILLPSDITDKHCPDICDVVMLNKLNEQEKLNDVVICCDSGGIILSRFGEPVWELAPLLLTKNTPHRRVNFTCFMSEPLLYKEIKLICYGWLFTENSQYSSPTKVSTIISRISGLKKTYEFLILNKLTSLTALENKHIWINYTSFLKEQNKTAGTLVHILSALQQAQQLFPWLGLPPSNIRLKPTKLSISLCRPEATEREQTLAIPESLADKLLHHAVTLIETAWTYRKMLGETERLLQENYEAGSKIVKEKIQSGKWKWLKCEENSARYKHDLAKEAFNFMPLSTREILTGNLIDYPCSSETLNGSWWQSHRANLMTAGFICCAAFSGMRESELYELTPESYYSSVFNGRTFHFLRGKTHKLGEKHTEWVVAPVVKKAVELIADLTSHLRNMLRQRARTVREKELAECLWLSQGRRSTIPKLISGWTLRFDNYIKHVGLIVSEDDYRECLRTNPNSTNKISRFVQIGKYWRLTPHQFRRTLAFFTIKNRLGNAIAIKQQFKHLYLQMAEWYCEGGLPSRLEHIQADTELQNMIDTVNNEQITNKYMEWMKGDQLLAGSFGKDILILREDLPVIYRSWESVYKLVKEKRLTLHGTLYAYCKNGYDCDMGGVINPAFCVSCSSHGSIIDEEQSGWWKQKHTSLTQYLSANIDISDAVFTHCITQIRAAEKVMTDFAIPFDVWSSRDRSQYDE